MSQLNENYEQLFDRLYKSGVYHLHQNFDALNADQKHYAFEVTRRFLDICRIINKKWPNTARYMTAIHGDIILEKIYSHLFDASDTTASLADAVYQSMRYVLKTEKDNVSCLLLNFERLTAQGINVRFIFDGLQADHVDDIAFEADFDFLNFYYTVDYYRRTSAPEVLFKHIKRIERATYAIHAS